MAITTCPDCDGKVSDAAAACPHCGRPSDTGDAMEPQGAAANPSGSAAPPVWVRPLLVMGAVGLIAAGLFLGVVPRQFDHPDPLIEGTPLECSTFRDLGGSSTVPTLPSSLREAPLDDPTRMTTEELGDAIVYAEERDAAYCAQQARSDIWLTVGLIVAGAIALVVLLRRPKGRAAEPTSAP